MLYSFNVLGQNYMICVERMRCNRYQNITSKVVVLFVLFLTVNCITANKPVLQILMTSQLDTHVPWNSSLIGLGYHDYSAGVCYFVFVSVWCTFNRRLTWRYLNLWKHVLCSVRIALPWTTLHRCLKWIRSYEWYVLVKRTRWSNRLTGRKHSRHSIHCNKAKL